MATMPADRVPLAGFHLNYPPECFHPDHDLPPGFLDIFTPLHRQFSPWRGPAFSIRMGSVIPICGGCQKTSAPTHLLEQGLRFAPSSAIATGCSVEKELLDGYMEDLATDGIYRLMSAQQMRNKGQVRITDESGKIVVQTPEFITQVFDDELRRFLENPGKDPGSAATFREARWSGMGV